MNPIITVRVEGGTVQSVEGIPPGVTVRVWDFDTDMADPERITEMPDEEPFVETVHGFEAEEAALADFAKLTPEQ